MTLQTGIHFGVLEDVYHADPAPEPSLSSSVAKILLEQSPRHAWHAHPRLGGGHGDRDNTRAMEVGTVVHKLLLGCGAEVVPIDAEDYRSKAAKEARDAAYAAAKQPILRADMKTAADTAAAVSDQLDKVDDCAGFGVDGAAEVVGIWRDETGPYGRLMVDWLEDRGDSAILWDIKTSSVSVAPHAIAQRIVSMGYDVSAAHYERGILALRPELAGKLTFRWIFVETSAPHLITIAELDAAGLAIGRKKAAAAFGLWARCLRDNVWPGYPNHIIRPDYPNWAENQWLARETADEDLLSLGADPFLMLSPWVPPRVPKTIVEAV